MVTVSDGPPKTERSPAATPAGRFAVSSATVNVSSSVSPSTVVVISPIASTNPNGIVMLDSVPWSPASELSRVTKSGIVTSSASGDDTLARTRTVEPSATGFGQAYSDTVGVPAGGSRASPSSVIVTSTEAGSPAFTPAGRLSASSATVNVSSSASPSTTVPMCA